jgi:ADP-ribose pyrophosphatase YjhB (NUDIX family)
MHAVGIIFEDKYRNILVLKRHHNSLEGTTWGLVGGKVDEGEDKNHGSNKRSERRNRT